MKVIIDSREQNRIQSATEYYKQQGLEVEVSELEIGDYIFSDGTDKVVFEFKTIADFVSSIQDGRVFNQSIEQSENFNHHFIIIHGAQATRAKCLAMSKHYRQVTVYQYLSAIASLNKYTTVIETSGPFINESFYRMMVQAKKCLINKPAIKRFPKKYKNTALNFLCYSIYGVNYNKAEKIVDTYQLESLTDLMQLTQEDLMNIEGIGENTARKILTAIGIEND